MKNLGLLRVGLAFAFGICFGNTVLADTSDWMTGRDAFRRAEKLRAAGMIVTRMDCKDSGQPQLDVDSALVRLHYTQNSKVLDWNIDGWNHLEMNKKYWAGRGFRLASYTAFARQKSGLKLYCTVYHK
jgi:hypothetical protein